MNLKPEITWDDFSKLDIRIGIVRRAEAFPEARRPAIKLWLDFGSEIGVLKTSAQITDFYAPEELPGLRLVAVVNFPPKQIGSFMSQCLVLGAYQQDQSVVLLQPSQLVSAGVIIG